MQPHKFRVARPTDKIDMLRHFYVDGLGLTVLGTFEDHDGYDGLILTTQTGGYEIEFTTFVDGSPCPAPSLDNLLVFYFDHASELKRIAARMKQIGYTPVAAENPYWDRHGLTFEDPDGWRVTVVA